jgi:orotate phosphoribosyltransferase
VITTGDSARRAAAAVEEAGGSVLGILAVVDREEGGKAALEADGRTVIALMTASTLGLVAS